MSCAMVSSNEKRDEDEDEERKKEKKSLALRFFYVSAYVTQNEYSGHMNETHDEP